MRGLLFIFLLLGASVRAAAADMDIVLVLPANRADEAARMAVAENTPLLDALSLTVTLSRLAPGEGDGQILARRLAQQGAGYAVLDLPAAEVRSLARAEALQDMLLLNIGAPDNARRQGFCTPYLFHVIPSRAMREQVLRDYRAQNANAAKPQLTAWDAANGRYGADQLLSRFRRFSGREMSSDDWLLWAAVGLVVKAGAKEADADPRALRDRFLDPAFAFHSYKGGRTHFLEENHQLQQPLLVMENHAVSAYVTPDPPAIAPCTEGRTRTDD